MIKRMLIFLLTFGLITGGTLAYFTDNAKLTSRGSAGTVAIEINSMIDLLDADGYDSIGPGDMRDSGFEIINMGNKSIDVRTTMALTIESDEYDLVFSGDSSTQSEFDLYKREDVQLVENQGYVPIEGASPLATKSVAGNVITYEISEYSLNGNSEKYGEVETVNGTGTYKYYYDYVLVFKNDTSEDWQDSILTIDIVAEAKQHENTGAGWEIVAKEKITQGSITKNVAVAEDRITK